MLRGMGIYRQRNLDGGLVFSFLFFSFLQKSIFQTQRKPIILEPFQIFIVYIYKLSLFLHGFSFPTRCFWPSCPRQCCRGPGSHGLTHKCLAPGYIQHVYFRHSNVFVHKWICSCGRKLGQFTPNGRSFHVSYS